MSVGWTHVDFDASKCSAKLLRSCADCPRFVLLLPVHMVSQRSLSGSQGPATEVEQTKAIMDAVASCKSITLTITNYTKASAF